MNAALLFARAGCLGTHIVEVDGDPTDVAVINLWPSEKEWNDFGALHGSPEFKDKVKSKEDGGMLGEPTFWAGTVA
ncbi:MAG: hypothetical protein KBC95_02295 [Candidatus Peribacteraceae bacterium]|nr:hypothetical protein [Candidatus Peribacteraceae bacterium]